MITKQSMIETILTKHFVSCDPEENWNACSDNDKFGYIDVAVVFRYCPETVEVFGDLINDEANWWDNDEGICWIWACAKLKGNRSSKYFLAGMESAPTIDGRSALGKALKKLYHDKIVKAKNNFYKQLSK